MSEEKQIVIPGSVLHRLPVFPLPNVVLFPNTDIPLHIFEPRYRQMMDDVIDNHRMFGLALLNKEDSAAAPTADETGPHATPPPYYPVAGLALIRSAARLPDGLYNIVVRGVARIDVSNEIIDPKSDHLYRIASAQIRQLDKIESPEALNQEFASFLTLAHRVLGGIKKVRIRFDQKIETIEDMISFVDAISALTLPRPEHRQSVLGSSCIFSRMRIASAALAELLIKTQQFDGGSSGWGVA
jgi:Lon protease-like protein